MKKVIIGLLAGLIMLVAGMLIGQVFHFFVPSLKTEYENPELFRPWTDRLMSLYYFVPFVTGVILAWIWDMTKEVISGDTITQKGLCFGLIYWLTTIPGMIMSYSSFPVSLALVGSWSTASLVQAFCAGLIFSKILK